ncbi:hypothetical protein M3Y94_01036500 [Aphelenchoides besseyi]|nr:hypothetical protein M3Y94_01036500 [Aphelenchoides besseyi]KAI6223964.1 hypothetical protein M3Y95_00832500 [Aphelenchoides besseyi]
MLRNAQILICFLSFLPAAFTFECFQWSYFDLNSPDDTSRSGEEWKDKFINYTVSFHMKRHDGWVIPEQAKPFVFNNRQYEIVSGDFLDLTVRPQCPSRKFITELECRLPWDELLNYNQRSKRSLDATVAPIELPVVMFSNNNVTRRHKETKAETRNNFLRLVQLLDSSKPSQVKWKCSNTESCCGIGCCSIESETNPKLLFIVPVIIVVLLLLNVKKDDTEGCSSRQNRSSTPNHDSIDAPPRQTQPTRDLAHETYTPNRKTIVCTRNFGVQTDTRSSLSNDAQCQTILSQSSLLPTYDELPQISEPPQMPSSNEFPPPYSGSN